MKKNMETLSKSKILMTLSIMSALSKNYKKVNESCVFALSGEKSRSSKIDISSATRKTLKFFQGLSSLDIKGSDETVLNFCDKASDILIAKSAGNVRIRSFEAIKNAIAGQLKSVNESGIDDSHKLVNELG